MLQKNLRKLKSMKKQMFIGILNFADYFLSVQRTLSWLSCLPYLVSRILSPVLCLLPQFSCLPSPGSRLMSTASCLPFPVSCLPVFHLLSPVYCLSSSVSCPLSLVSRLPCCNCCRYNSQYNHLADLAILWSKLTDFGNLAILTLLADLAD